MQTQQPRMPAVFIGHGSPMNTLERNRYTQTWNRFGRDLPKPKAILAISAHWYISGTAVTAMPTPRTIHDFNGFPPELFAFQYPAAGDPQLAARVAQLLAPLKVHLDQAWGLDHGTWSVLAHVFPEADVPVVQLAMDATQPPAYHYEIASKLAALRDEGVLIVASGNVVHNLRMLQWARDTPPYDWALRFNDQARACLLQRDHAALIDYGKFGEAARLAVPTPEHYLPLLYTIALQRDDEALSILVDGVELGSISMLSFAVGNG